MEIHAQVLNAFQAEHREMLEVIRNLLQQAAASQFALDRTALDEAFRMAHSFKGGARICNLTHMETLGHNLETLFERIRKGTMALDARVANVVTRVLDCIEDWMIELAAGRDAGPPRDIIAAIEAVDDGLPGASLAPDELVALHNPDTHENPKPPEPPCSPSVALEQPIQVPHHAESASPHEEVMRIGAGALDGLLQSAVHMAGESSRLGIIEDDTVALARSLNSLAMEWNAVREANFGALQGLRIDRELRPVMRFLDGLDVRLRNEQRFATRLSARQRSADWTLQSLGNQLRARALEARTVEAASVFHGFRRMVRDVANDTGRQAELSIIGGDLRADRAVLQALKNPLMHLLRNAVAHGIELPGERAAANKPARGNVRLILRCVGSRLVVRVEDDGRGLDHQRIEEAAHRLGLFESDDTEAERCVNVTKLIFKAGLTTCASVDAIAGRGIGLSDVYETVERLQGQVAVDSNAGQGTVFEIDVPMSIASHRLLFVRCDEGVFGIPVHDIERLMSVSMQCVETIEGWPVISVDGKPVRIAQLSQLVGGPMSTPEGGAAMPIAIIRSGTGRMAIAANEFVAEREVLIKELSGPLREIEIYQGGVILEDGSIALVLRPSALRLNSALKDATESPRPQRRVKERTPSTVLVVDDSFTTRTLEKSLLEAHGYTVRIAVDGVEALTHLQSDHIDLVITDIEMPHMDGLTLLERIRSNPRFARLPVIIVSSVKQAQQQQRGLELGADAYVVKQKFDHEELLRTVEQLV